MKPLKDREKSILEFMKKEIKQKGYPPTVREICQALGIKSTSTVHKDIASLNAAGYISKNPSKPRALVINYAEEGENSSIQNVERTDIADIPVVGRIAAGTPILADENIEEYFPVPSRYLGRNETFMLTVRGKSMVEAGIMDGDYILVERQNTANNGDIVVAMIDGFESEATVKTFYREDDHVRLQPENSSMSPIIVNDVTVLGKVKGVFRYF